MSDAKYWISQKSYLTTLFLCFFLGSLGLHRFYVGKKGTATLMLLTLGGFGIWQMVDFVMILLGSFSDKAGREIIPFIKNKLHKCAVYFAEDQSLELAANLESLQKRRQRPAGKRHPQL